MSARLRSSWSSIQAASPIGESASAYSVWRRFAELERLGNVGRNRCRHIGVNAEQFRRCLESHLLRDRIPPIAALRDKSGVAETLHQHGPGACDALRIPAGRGRLAGKAVARNRGDDDIERVRRTPTICGRIGQWIDDL